VVARYVAGLVMLAAVAASSTSASTAPRPLVGVPLRGATHLLLLVASNPPYLLDVDTGQRTRVSGLKLGSHSVLGVSAVGNDALIHVYRADRGRSYQIIYVLRQGETHAMRLATASQAASSADGSAVWLKSYADATHCTVRVVALDGTERQSPRAIACSAELVEAGSKAVLLDGDSVLDPSTGTTLVNAPRLVALTRDLAVTSDGSQSPITVADLRTGERWRLRYPSRIGGQGGMGSGKVHPSGRFVAIEFGDPAYHFTGTQVIDIWLLDLATRRLRELPDTPAAVSLKFTSMQWTSDGRLVILAETAERTVVAVWRPGRKRIRVRPVRIPQRNSGSDSFVAWVTSTRR
jgi:hypothetical protein